MKKKYDIRINPTPLSSEEIAQRKDFDRVLEAFQEKSLQQEVTPTRFRTLYRVAAVAATLLLCWLAYTSFPAGDGNYEKQAAAYFAEHPYVNVPPVPAAKPSFTNRSINAQSGGEVILTNGSRIQVPTDAFEDATGNPVDGEVEIRFREMHDYVDFFLSGIPMVYDSANVKYTLESAGMLEIYAEQNGKQVKLRPGKSIDVELVSELQMPNLEIPPGYNIYKLDTTARAWKYQDIDRMEIVESRVNINDENDPLFEVQQQHANILAEIGQEETTAIQELEASLRLPDVPQEPKVYDPDAFVFDFDIADVSGGTIQLPYENALWQLSPGQDIEAITLNRNWDGIELQPENNRDYRLNLSAGEEILSVLVLPVLSGNAYEEAMAQYRLDLDYYQQLLADNADLLESRKKEIRQSYDLERANAQAYFHEMLLDFQKENQLTEAPMMRHKVVNRFTANSFGIWNCDRPVAPKMATIKGKFQDQQGNSFENNLAFLVDKSRNTIERIYIGETTELHLSTNSQNLMWIITPDNKIAIFRPEDFEALDLEEEEQTFVFEVSDRRVDTEMDLREILYF